jgi:hypothetical protein
MRAAAERALRETIGLSQVRSGSLCSFVLCPPFDSSSDSRSLQKLLEKADRGRVCGRAGSS